ncbi:MAG: methylmalonyl-CoA mutase family protein [Geminicoccaceae bacterium]
MAERVMTFANGFPEPSEQAWRAMVDRGLKGSSFEETLVRKTDDGLDIQPLYTSSDLPAGTGVAPGRRTPTWRIEQCHDHPSPDACNRRILDDLTGGAEAIRLVVGSIDHPGLLIADQSDLEHGLDGVLLEAVSINIDAGPETGRLAELYLDLLSRRGFTGDAISGSLGFDPIGCLARFGRYPLDLPTACDQAIDAAMGTAELHPRLQSLMVDLRPYHDAGASRADMLAILLSAMVMWLRAGERRSLDPEKLFRQLRVLIPVDCDFFDSMASVRAARLITARLGQEVGVQDPEAWFAAETAWRMLSRRDVHVNLLRNTIAGFAAGIGGADSVTVRPFTDRLGLASGFAQRMARNTQHLLLEESHLGRVADPAAGSFAIEHRTESLAALAWSVFREIEGQGGLDQALREGWLQGRLEVSRKARSDRLSRDVDGLIGINMFADLSEKAVPIEPCDRARLLEAYGSRVRQIKPAAEMTPLPRQALAEPFEALRDRADAFEARHGERPKVFVFPFGTEAESHARMRFLQGLMATGGIDVERGGGFDDAETTDAPWRDRRSPIAVLNSVDETHRALAETTARGLKEAGARAVYLVLEPEIDEARWDDEGWRAAGIDGFIHERVDRIALLTAIHDQLAPDAEIVP